MSTPNPIQPEKKSNMTKILIGCGVLGLVSLPVCGILAAIAIPAFLRSVKKSKEAEALAVTRQFADFAKTEWEMNCAFPPPLEATNDPVMSCGGAKNLPSVSDPAAHGAISLSDPMYFIYSTELTSTGADEAIFTIEARHDFNCDSPQMHTVQINVTGSKAADGTCTALIAPSRTLNEFE